MALSSKSSDPSFTERNKILLSTYASQNKILDAKATESNHKATRYE